ncbi:Protein trichome birefringence [Rhynchospora pubera]|uniref:Protein trichome birefringence n=1 Tax=Rhynchospora pubera TaxID=906938 RepID=A0AAV8HKJ8_9POAL|nr:Protein trichome birefringence [Rhynchospora pubera]
MTNKKRDMSWISQPWRSSLHRKTNHILVKVIVSIFLIGISYRLLFSRYGSGEKLFAPTTEILGRNSTDEGKCNLCNGVWMPNPSGPAYTNLTCRFIEDHQNCLMNGRPDRGYLHWGWKPYQCDLPPFDPYLFLDAMKNKNWGFIGDSILRNQIQSFLCLLSKAEEPVELYHSSDFKSRQWQFQKHNLTVSLIWTPFLVSADIFEDENGVSDAPIQLHLDSLDQSWAGTYPKFDYVVISGGQWFLKHAVYLENNSIVGCHYCPDKNYAELGYEFSYRKTLELVFQHITNLVGKHIPVVIFRTWAPSHFENGQWFDGGICNRTAPYKEGEFNGSNVDQVMREIEFQEFEKAKKTMESSGKSNYLKLIDTYQLAVMRPDGHVGPYRRFHKDKKGKVQYDCLHWCVPGPIDAWNDIIMDMVLK